MTVSYTYDALHRLIAADYSSTGSEQRSDGSFYHYTYDAVGNRLTQESMVNGQRSTVHYQYDDANRLTSVNGIACTWDNNGNLLSDGTNTYTYDSTNRLISIVNQQSSIVNRYNGLGDRLIAQLDTGTLDAEYFLRPELHRGRAMVLASR